MKNIYVHPSNFDEIIVPSVDRGLSKINKLFDILLSNWPMTYGNMHLVVEVFQKVIGPSTSL